VSQRIGGGTQGRLGKRSVTRLPSVPTARNANGLPQDGVGSRKLAANRPARVARTTICLDPRKAIAVSAIRSPG